MTNLSEPKSTSFNLQALQNVTRKKELKKLHAYLLLTRLTSNTGWCTIEQYFEALKNCGISNVEGEKRLEQLTAESNLVRVAKDRIHTSSKKEYAKLHGGYKKRFVKFFEDDLKDFDSFQHRAIILIAYKQQQAIAYQLDQEGNSDEIAGPLFRDGDKITLVESLSDFPKFLETLSETTGMTRTELIDILNK